MSATELSQVHRTCLRLIGLQSNPRPFERRGVSDPDVDRLVRGREGLRIPQTADVYEGLVWSIVGQQVNLAFAYTCRNALIDLAGTRAPRGRMAHPTPRAVAALDYADLTRRQYSRRKAEYVIDASRDLVEGRLGLEDLPATSATRARERLLSIRGFGPWSTQYVLMRSCGFLDCVPVGDAGLVRSLQEFFELDARPDARHTQSLMAPFAPHRSLAAFHLWRRLEPAL